MITIQPHGAETFSVNEGGRRIAILTCSDAVAERIGAMMSDSSAAQPAKLDPDAIAKGHNPGRIPNYKLETQDGWRLLGAEEIGEHPWLRSVQMLGVFEWISGAYAGCNPEQTYRTKLTVSELAAARKEGA